MLAVTRHEEGVVVRQERNQGRETDLCGLGGVFGGVYAWDSWCGGREERVMDLNKQQRRVVPLVQSKDDRFALHLSFTVRMEENVGGGCGKQCKSKRD